MQAVTSYADALDFIAGGRSKTERPIANNTRLVKWSDHPMGRIGLRLHQTDVVTLYENGDVVFDTGGWHTVTTKDRMNYHPAFAVYVADGWYIEHRPTVERVTRQLRDKYGLPHEWANTHGYGGTYLGSVGARGRKYGFWGEVGELIGFKEAVAIYKAYEAELKAKTVYRFFDSIRFTKRGRCVNGKPGLETS